MVTLQKRGVRKKFIIVTLLVTVLVILILKGIAYVISNPIGAYQHLLMAQVNITEPLKIRSSAKLKEEIIKYIKEWRDAEVTQTGPEGWIKIPSIIQKIKIIGNRATPILVEIMKDKTQDRIIRHYGLSALEEIGDKNDKRCIPELIEMLHKGDEELRANAVSVLGYIKDKRAVEPLIWGLKDECIHVRKESALALGKIRDKSAVEPLIKALERAYKEYKYLKNMSIIDRKKYWHHISDSNDMEVFMRISITSIGEIGGEEATTFLLQELRQGKYDIKKEEIIETLGYTRDSRAVKLLLRELKENRYNVDKQCIIKALSHTKDEQVVPVLREIFWIPQEEHWVRMEIIEALTEIGSKDAIKELEKISREGQNEILRNEATRLLKIRKMIDWGM